MINFIRTLDVFPNLSDVLSFLKDQLICYHLILEYAFIVNVIYENINTGIFTDCMHTKWQPSNSGSICMYDKYTQFKVSNLEHFLLIEQRIKIFYSQTFTEMLSQNLISDQ